MQVTARNREVLQKREAFPREGTGHNITADDDQVNRVSCQFLVNGLQGG